MPLSGHPTYSFTEISPFYEPGLDNPPSATPPPALSQTPIIITNGSTRPLTQRNLGVFIPSPGSSPHLSPLPKSDMANSTVTTTPRSHITFRSPPSSRIPDESEPRLRGHAPTGQQHPSSSTRNSKLQPPEETPGEDTSCLIPKPDGEAGRPGRGGYTLEDTLGWKKKEFKVVKKYVKGLINMHLDSSQSFSHQSSKSLKVIRVSAADRFDFLLLYENCWPVSDLIRQQLKYTSRRARLESNRLEAEDARMRRRGRR